MCRFDRRLECLDIKMSVLQRFFLAGLVLYVEPKMHDIAFPDDVVLSFEAK